ncbi:MAG TPA: efflux transporter outer membrane subunit [Polyangia bacterium]|nr:efflux transporter outer membrane subunit [Polyangia bacterium]
MRAGHQLAVLSLAVLAGCAVGPDFKPPAAAVPPTWRVSDDPRLATAVAAESQWWKSFNDPALDNLIELGRKQNLPLQIAGLRIVESRAQLAIAFGQLFPQIQALFGSALANRLSQNSPQIANLPNIPGFNPTTSFIDYQAGFDAAWELDFWGKYRRGIQAGTASLLSQVADYYSGIVSLSAEVARTYVLIRTSEVLIDLAIANVKLQEQALQIATARFQNGATSELDPTQAAAQLEATRASIPQLQIGLEQAGHALCTLLGLTQGTVETLLAGARQIPKAPASIAVGMPAEMLRRRPDIRSAELTAAAQCARIGVAKAELFPSFTLLGSIGLESSSHGSNFTSFATTDSLFYTAGPRVNLPFLNYGRLTNGVRVQDARFQELLVSYQNTVLQAAQEVEDGLSGYLRSQEQAAAEDRAVAAAQRAVEIATAAYREGAVDFQRVIDAQRTLLGEQNNAAQATSAISTNLIAVYKALGGGWEPYAGEPVVPAQTQREMKARTNWGDLLSEPSRVETKSPATKPQMKP